MQAYRYLSICVLKNGNTFLDAIWKSKEAAEEHVSSLNDYEREINSGDLWSVKKLKSYEK